MKEQIKVLGYGSLHEKEYGKIKIDNKPQKLESVKSIMYDSNLDQYCVDGQWQIPFHKEGKLNLDKIENQLKSIQYEMSKLKADFVKSQKFEISASFRDIEKNIIKLIKLIKKEKEC